MILEEIGSLAIRVGLGWLFLTGAWASCKDKAGRDFTVAETALVFKWRPELFATLGILMLGAGGLSVLFGVFPRLGALTMTVFLVPRRHDSFQQAGAGHGAPGRDRAGTAGQGGGGSQIAHDDRRVRSLHRRD